MLNQLKNLLNSRVTEYSMMLLVCCMIGTSLATADSNQWTSTATVFALAGGATLFCWLAWGTYVLATKKELTAMSPRQRLIPETINIILMLVWVYVTSRSFLFVLPWTLLFGWYEYRLIKEYIEAKRTGDE